MWLSGLGMGGQNEVLRSVCVILPLLNLIWGVAHTILTGPAQSCGIAKPKATVRGRVWQRDMSSSEWEYKTPGRLWACGSKVSDLWPHKRTTTTKTLAMLYRPDPSHRSLWGNRWDFKFPKCKTFVCIIPFELMRVNKYPLWPTAAGL